MRAAPRLGTTLSNLVTTCALHSFSYGRGWRGPCLGEDAGVKSLEWDVAPCERSGRQISGIGAA